MRYMLIILSIAFCSTVFAKSRTTDTTLRNSTDLSKSNTGVIYKWVEFSDRFRLRQRKGGCYRMKPGAQGTSYDDFMDRDPVANTFCEKENPSIYRHLTWDSRSGKPDGCYHLMPMKNLNPNSLLEPNPVNEDKCGKQVASSNSNRRMKNSYYSAPVTNASRPSSGGGAQ